jgi:hypothetical protein
VFDQDQDFHVPLFALSDFLIFERAKSVDALRTTVPPDNLDLPPRPESASGELNSEFAHWRALEGYSQ